MSITGVIPQPILTKALTAAVQSNTAAVQQAASTYQTDVLAVAHFMASVMGSSLPQLNENPSNWNAITTAYGDAYQSALSWTNTVMAHLKTVPGSITKYNKEITDLLNDAAAQAKKLQSNPNDSVALEQLQNDLSTLSDPDISPFVLVGDFITGALTAIQNYDDKLPSLVSELVSVVTGTVTASAADQAKIAALTSEIASLHQDIKSLYSTIAGFGVAIGVAVVIGCVATVLAFPVGLAAWLFCGAIIAVAGVYISIDEKKIAADQAQIQSDQDEMNQLTADMAALSLVTQTFLSLTMQTALVAGDLKTVLQSWQTLSSDLASAMSDVTTATNDTNSDNFAAALTDIQNATTEWNAITSAIAPMTIDIQGNNCSLKVGDSQDQVTSAANAAKTMDIVAYFNLLNAA